jgi:hypothetical protein
MNEAMQHLGHRQSNYQEGTEVQMTSKLKALGLALVAVFAMSAIVAQGAQAAKFHSNSERTVVTGELESANPDEFSIAGFLTIRCEAAKFEGTIVGKEVDTSTITPTYGNTAAPSKCKNTLTGHEVIVHTQHCAYVFHAATNAEEHGLTDVECSGATENTFVLTDPADNFTMKIGAQTNLNGVHYTNLEEEVNKVKVKYITAKSTVKGIHWTCEGGGCFLGKEGNGGEYKGGDVLRGWKDEGSELVETGKTTPTEAATKEGERTSIWWE